jgi:D-tyrosyl-tRNA(Tyr) deacylase
MRIIIQRVTEASVIIDNTVRGAIGSGLLVLVGFEAEDTIEDIEWMAAKLVNMRIFNDEAGLMNLSVLDVKGEILVVSQFTLYAATKKGNRPSFIRAAKPDIAIPLYNQFLLKIKALTGKIATGEFGADMAVALVNDGPVTISVDSRQKE